MFKAVPWIPLLHSSLSKPQISQPALQIFSFIEVEQCTLWATCETSSFFVLLFSPQSIISFTLYSLALPFLTGHLEHKVMCRKLSNLVIGPTMTYVDTAKLDKLLNKRESKSAFLSYRDGSTHYGDYCQ